MSCERLIESQVDNDEYRDVDGDTWERCPDGLYRVSGDSNAEALTLERLRAAFGPLSPVDPWPYIWPYIVHRPAGGRAGRYSDVCAAEMKAESIGGTCRCEPRENIR